MKGEYIGHDGRTYRWVKEAATGHYTLSVRDPAKTHPSWSYVDIHPEDWPAAKAALDALIEGEEWVEIAVDGAKIQVARDGSDGRWRWVDSQEWRQFPEIPGALDLYRAGLRIGREESKALREAVLAVPGAPFLPKWFDRILSLAKEG